jgi:hypothetical protein
MTRLPTSAIWKARTEPKCRFFAWLAMHDRVLTTENMLTKNWMCDPLCSLCSCMNEMTSHLLIQCNYTEAVWNLVAGYFNLPNYSLMGMEGGPKGWVQAIRRTGDKNEKKRKLGVLLSFWWMLWKERNQRIF